MPSNYLTVPLNGVISGIPPNADSLPVVSLPNDGEAATIAPIAGAFGQIMSEMGWLKKPQADEHDAARAIRRYRNVLGHTRFAIDHHGLPSGRIFKATENWLGVDLVQKTTIATDQAWGGNWRYDLSASGMVIEAQWAGAGGQPSPCLHMQVGSSNGIAQVYAARDWVLRAADQVITWQTELVMPNVTDISSVTMEFGLGTSGNDHGARFVKRFSDTNWQMLTNLSGSSVYTDLGVSAATTARRRLRFDIMGPNVGDVGPGSACILVFIDGTLWYVLPYTIGGSESLRPWFKLQRTSTGSGSTFHCYLNTMDVCSSLWPSDVLT